MCSSPQPIPFFRPDLHSAEIQAVKRVLESGWLNTGNECARFEAELQDYLAAKEVVCLSSCWAAMFAALKAFGVGSDPRDEVIVPNLTFTATASCVLQCNAKVRLADVDGYHISAESVAKKLSPHTKAIIAVDYGGYPCDYPALQALLEKTPFRPTNTLQEALARPLLLTDAAHSIGSLPPKKAWKSDLAAYSFHTVKNITTGDGGAVAVFNSKLKPLCKALRLLSQHGISRTAYQREVATEKPVENCFEESRSATKEGTQLPHAYDILAAGYKLNMTDISASMGRTQLARIDEIAKRRNALAITYDAYLKQHSLFNSQEMSASSRQSFKLDALKPAVQPDKTETENACNKDGFKVLPGLSATFAKQLADGKTLRWSVCPHLYTVEIPGVSSQQKNKIISDCHSSGISLNEHYRPLSLLSFYQKNLPQRELDKHQLSQSLTRYRENLSLPFYNTLTKRQQHRVVKSLWRAVG